MTWEFRTVPQQGGLATALVRNPEFGETWTSDRRQVAAQSDGGQEFVEDLGLQDRFVEARWAALDAIEWSDLERLFRAARWRFTKIDIDIDSPGAPFPFELSTGLSQEGVELNTGQSVCAGRELNTGDTVLADKGRLAGVFLDTSRTSFAHQRTARAGLSLVFRLPSQSTLKAGS